MAEPLAIIGAVKSIAGIIDILGKSISTIRELRRQWKDADFNVLNISTQLTALRAALAKIKEWGESYLGVPHHQLIIDLDDSVACCGTIVEKIDAWLSELQKKPNRKLEVSGKIKSLIGSKSIDDLQRTLELQTNALTLLLTVCNCKTSSEQKALLERSSSRKTLTCVKIDSASLVVHRDSASLLSHYTDNLSKFSMVFNFDTELLSSKVYERAVRGLIKAAMRRRHPGANSDTSSIIAHDISKRNQDIEKLILADKQRQNREVKMLLLGTDDEDTSYTMKIIQLTSADGFSESERKRWRVRIFHNLVNAFRALLAHMDEQEGEFSDDENLKYARLVLSDRDIEPDDPLPYEFLQVFTSLWEDEGTQLAILKASEYALHDNLSYFFTDIDRLFLPNYLPSNLDILRTRVRTTGINESVFNCGSSCFRIFDTGGQRTGRTKWMHQFDNTEVVIFQSTMSSYDETSTEDGNLNRMAESLRLFQHISNSPYFKRSGIILLFTEMERFRDKLSSGYSPIHRHFPDYQGSPCDIEAAQSFLAQKFKCLVQRPDVYVYIHYVNSTDTNVFKKIHYSVADMIIHRTLNDVITG